MKEYFLKQCRLERKVPNGTATLVSYIPEQFAKLGKFVKLRNEEGEWTDGYKVVFASEGRMSSNSIVEVERRHLNQRKASDI